MDDKSKCASCQETVVQQDGTRATPLEIANMVDALVILGDCTKCARVMQEIANEINTSCANCCTAIVCHDEHGIKRKAIELEDACPKIRTNCEQCALRTLAVLSGKGSTAELGEPVRISPDQIIAAVTEFSPSGTITICGKKKPVDFLDLLRDRSIKLPPLKGEPQFPSSGKMPSN